MFEDESPAALIGVIEDSHRSESMLIARRLAAVAALLWHRTGEAEDASPTDPGYALITGFARTTAEVAAALNLPPMTASRIVDHAEALDTRLPEVAGLLARGLVDWSTAKLVITRTALVDGELVGMLDRLLADRIESWEGWSRRRVINAIDAAVRIVDARAAKERRVTADTARHVRITNEPNGMASVRGSVPAPAAALLDKRLSELATSVCTGDPRTLDQRRADALVALGEGRGLACECPQADCPRRPGAEAPTSRFVINVIASQETVTGRSDQPGYLEGYGVIDADQVRDLAEHAALRPVAEPAVTETQALTYQPSAALERWVRCRDLTCRFPGCDRPAWRADIDHTEPFDHADPAAGGHTTARNNKCYCRQHHRLKTFLCGPGGWRDEQLADGTVVFTSPAGRVYRNTPAGADLFPQLRPPPCAEPVPRKQNRQRDKAARIRLARRTIHAQRESNAHTRTLNRARRREIDNRRWRNDMRRKLLVFKGGRPSTSPWCLWVNEPLEDEHITADWRPPPSPPRSSGSDAPPF